MSEEKNNSHPMFDWMGDLCWNMSMIPREQRRGKEEIHASFTYGWSTKCFNLCYLNS